MNLDHAEVFIAGAIAGVGALWQAAKLRPELQKEWTPRIKLAEGGLADRGVRELVSIRREIERLLGSGAASVPRLATVDPTVLSQQIRDFQKTTEAARRLKSRFQWLLRIGPLGIVAALLFLLGDAALFANHSQLASSEPMRLGGLTAIITAGVLGAADIAAWILLLSRLSAAESRAAEDSDESADG